MIIGLCNELFTANCPVHSSTSCHLSHPQQLHGEGSPPPLVQVDERWSPVCFSSRCHLPSSHQMSPSHGPGANLSLCRIIKPPRHPTSVCPAPFAIVPLQITYPASPQHIRQSSCMYYKTNFRNDGENQMNCDLFVNHNC